MAIQNKEADVFVTSGADKSATNMVEPTSLVGGSRSPVLTNEPTATIDNEPAVNTDELATNTAEPMANTDEPAANTVANTDEPAANTDEPTANTDEPTANTDEPTANTDEPTANTNEPGAKTDEPGANTDEPGANTDEPILLVGVSQSLVNAEPISKSPNVERNTSGDKVQGSNTPSVNPIEEDLPSQLIGLDIAHYFLKDLSMSVCLCLININIYIFHIPVCSLK